jgi:predicted outer membrane repeat protein
MKKALQIFLIILTIGFNAHATKYYVAADRNNSGDGLTWATAKKDLQEAINLAVADDTIWVKRGIYYPTHDATGNTNPADPRTKTFLLKSGVKIYGNFIGTETVLSERASFSFFDFNDPPIMYEPATILSGEIQQDNDATNNTYRVVTGLDLNSNSLLDVLTIQDGYALGAIQTGAGLYIAALAANTNSLQVHKCLFKNNYSANQGGAVYIESNTDDTIDAIFQECLFIQNKAAFDGGAVEIVAFDGGINTSKFNKCGFYQNEANSGGAVQVLADTDGEASPIFNQSVYNSNISVTDAGVFSNYVTKGISNTVIEENFFVSNIAGGNGGAIFSMVIEGENNLSITNSKFFENKAGSTYSGGAVIIYALNTAGTNNTKLQKCEFKLNEAKFGGAISFLGEKGNIKSHIYQSLFVRNKAAYGGAIDSYVDTDGNINSFIINCTITKNTATEGAAVETFQDNDGLSGNYIQNSIIWGNTNSGTNPDVLVGSTTDSLRTSLVGNIDCSQWKDGNCSRNIFDKNPEFKDDEDDNYQLSLCSPAINTGFESEDPIGLESTDLDGLNRNIETIDMGAYEHQSPESRILATTGQKTIEPVTIRLNESFTFFSPTNCEIILNLTSEGASPLNAPVKAAVWLDATQAPNYVSRHYEIDANTAPATAPARVTLYFTKDEFRNFNAVNTVKLPRNEDDYENFKANLLIEKRNGISSDGTGNPATYSGGITTIDPEDTDIVYNEVKRQWEVTFAVEGFSGFFVKTLTTNLPLPINLISFSGKNTEKGNLLTWQTSNEKDFSHFEVERSSDGKRFEKVGKVQGQKSENYQYIDNSTIQNSQSEINYYRLKMVDLDGKYNYSNTISIENYMGKTNVGNFYPNPSQGITYIDITTLEKGDWNITTFDITGKVTHTQNTFLQKGLNTLTLGKLGKGVNLVKFENKGKVIVRRIVGN